MAGPTRHRHCSACGAAYADITTYPRRCHACGLAVWANPIPVAVALVPIVRDGRTCLLVVRTGLEPGRGKLTLVGGFIEEHESWQVAAAREVREETGLVIDPAAMRLFDVASSEPRPDRLLVFATTDPVPFDRLPPFEPGREALERGLIHGPGGIEHVFAFGPDIEAIRRWFAWRWTADPHDYTAC
jgi:ADP-ribose pyrophosphatase YjhB (NUDIX family)